MNTQKNTTEDLYKLLVKELNLDPSTISSEKEIKFRAMLEKGIKSGMDLKNLIHTAKLTVDRVYWCRHNLVFYSEDDEAKQMLAFNPRFNQEWILKCDSRINPNYKDPKKDARYIDRRWAIYSCRGSGKTAALAAKALEFAHRPGGRKEVLVVVPYGPQTKVMWTYLNMMMMPHIRDGVNTIDAKQTLITFKNGSSINMFVSGKDSGSQGQHIRGQNGDLIILDEAAYLPDDLVSEVVGPVLNRRKWACIIVSSTASNIDENTVFRNIFEEPSSITPWITKVVGIYDCDWMSEADRQEAKEDCKGSAEAWRREWLCEFGGKIDGAYPYGHLFGEPIDLNDKKEDQGSSFPVHGWRINPSVIKYDPNFLDYNKNNQYFIGVDWNGPRNGIWISIVERVLDVPRNHYMFNKLRYFKKIVVESKDYDPDKAVNALIQLNSTYEPLGIYVDKGYGNMYISSLLNYGMANPYTHLTERVVAVDLSGTLPTKNQKYSDVQILDPENPPIADLVIRHPSKMLLVNTASNLLRLGRLILPEIEARGKDGLVNIMLEVRIADNKKKVEVPENDHLHDSYVLALFGYFDRCTIFGVRSNILTADTDYTPVSYITLPSPTVDKIIPEPIEEKSNRPKPSTYIAEDLNKFLRDVPMKRRGSSVSKVAFSNKPGNRVSIFASKNRKRELSK